ncbi:DUF134 domain-containing protein [Xylanivirga thermophila]|uniref:DUF134 domain-containing protein n=1 Tax=Xylanivirga thermophila TaxID=2496273 RepID=UPI00101C7B7E|nr:DUF134 domain-containing protein [Xylanivirga thermophila]
MPRPRKWKRVCNMPKVNTFGPCIEDNDITGAIQMTVEEFETIRLIDHEGLNQEQCSEIMGIGRSTVQRLYEKARRKIADSIVNGKVLKIEGGDYRVCSDLESGNACEKCIRNRYRRGRNI